MPGTREKPLPITPDQYLDPEVLRFVLARGERQEQFDQMEAQGDWHKAQRYAVVCDRMDRGIRPLSGGKAVMPPSAGFDDAFPDEDDDGDDDTQTPPPPRYRPEGFEQCKQFLEQAAKEGRKVTLSDVGDAVGWPRDRFKNARVRGARWAMELEPLYLQVAAYNYHKPQGRDVSAIKAMVKQAIKDKKRISYLRISKAIGRSPQYVNDAVRKRREWVLPLIPLFKEAGLPTDTVWPPRG